MKKTIQLLLLLSGCLFGYNTKEMDKQKISNQQLTQVSDSALIQKYMNESFFKTDTFPRHPLTTPNDYFFQDTLLKA